MACNEAVSLAAILISLEFVGRSYQSRQNRDEYSKDTTFDDYKNHCYIIFFLISIFATVIYVSVLKSVALPKSLEWYIPILYLFDSVGAIGLGCSLFYENKVGVFASMLVLTNFFLLHILHTLFAKKGGGLVSDLHSAYLFLCWSTIITLLLHILFCAMLMNYVTNRAGYHLCLDYISTKKLSFHAFNM